MTTATIYFSTISDVYKDANGSRPSVDWLNHFHSLPFAEQEAIFDRLVGEVLESMDLERRQEEQAFERWTAKLDELVALGAGDYETAVRWLHDAHGTNGDLPYLLWHFGITSFETEARVKQILR